MSDKSESFEEWWELFELECISSDDNFKVIDIVKSAWNHQQKKIDELMSDFAGYENFKRERELDEKLQAAEEEIKDYQEGWLGCCHTCEPVAIKNKWQNEVIHRLSERLDFVLDRFDTLLGGEAGMKHIREFNKEIKKEIKNER